MSEPPDSGRLPAQAAGRSRVLAWALWDTGSTGVFAIVTTFVFPVYLTDAVGAGMSGETSPTSWLGWALAGAGVAVAVLAPVTGIWVDAPWRRRRMLAALTGLAVLLTSAMVLVRDDHRYFWLGLVLLAATAACTELATVPYNAMLRQLSTPQTSGRISGFGWGMGYVGTVVLLLIIYFGFVSGDGDTRGLFGVPIADGQNIRAAMLLTAVWFALFAVPVIVAVPAPPPDPEVRREAVGFFDAYRNLWSEVVGEWHRDRNVVYYLLASAVFRDGLAGIFAFGAVLGVNVYGISEADVLLFGVIASVVAAIGAVLGGLLDDRLGSKPVIVGSLAAMIVVGLTLMTLSGALMFWIFGLLLTLFVGPAQSAARTMMLRLSAEGKEGVAFGLYTTTGRAVSFLAPTMFSTFIYLFGADRAGMGGLCVVLIAGLLAMLAVRAPRQAGSR
jgi:UMF1 family MFS transporter